MGGCCLVAARLSRRKVGWRSRRNSVPSAIAPSTILSTVTVAPITSTIRGVPSEVVLDITTD